MFLCFGECLNTVRAHTDALARDSTNSRESRPLKIWFLAGFAGRVVVTAQKHSAGNHAGTFIALGAFDGHSLDIVTENW